MAGCERPDAPSCRDTELEELLADDVTRAVMQADRVGVAEVRGLCRAVGALLERRVAAARSGAPHSRQGRQAVLS